MQGATAEQDLIRLVDYCFVVHRYPRALEDAEPGSGICEERSDAGILRQCRTGDPPFALHLDDDHCLRDAQLDRQTCRVDHRILANPALVEVAGTDVELLE